MFFRVQVWRAYCHAIVIEVLAEEGLIFKPDMAWYNAL